MRSTSSASSSSVVSTGELRVAFPPIGWSAPTARLDGGENLGLFGGAERFEVKPHKDVSELRALLGLPTINQPGYATAHSHDAPLAVAVTTSLSARSRAAVRPAGARGHGPGAQIFSPFCSRWL